MTTLPLASSNSRTGNNPTTPAPRVTPPAVQLRAVSKQPPSRLPQNAASLQPAKANWAIVNLSPARSRNSCAIQGEFKLNLLHCKQGCGAPGNSTLQQKPSLGMIQPKLPAGVEAFRVNLQQRAGGWPLPKEVQAKMESALGADFSDVRIHVGSEVPAIGAIAFTWGSNIHFAPGYYNPHTLHGQQLLAHELTHVVQQRAGRVRNPYGSGVAVVQDHALEAEADRMAQRALTMPAPQGAR